jgi:hypothetical protein
MSRNGSRNITHDNMNDSDEGMGFISPYEKEKLNIEESKS